MISPRRSYVALVLLSGLVVLSVSADPLAAQSNPASREPAATAVPPSSHRAVRLAAPSRPADPALPRLAEVLVRFDESIGVCAAAAFERRGTEPVLDPLFDRIGVVAVEPLLRPSASGRGPAGQPLATAALARREADWLSALATERGLDVERTLRQAPRLYHLYRLRLAPDADAAVAARELESMAQVDFAEANGHFRTAVLPDDPYLSPGPGDEWSSGAWGQSYSDLWGLESSGWGEIWDRRVELWPDPARRGGGGVVVAVIDTGVDLAHPDLAANLWRDNEGNAGRDLVDIDLQVYLDAGFVAVPGEDYSDEDSEPRDRNGHGTHVSGTVAAVADNGVGIAGVAWNSELMAIRSGFALGLPRGGQIGAFEFDDLAAAIVWAAENGAQVINMSLGGTNESDAVNEALDLAAALEVVLIASAGNADFATGFFYPANHSRVAAVGALEPDDRRAWFSNFGSSMALTAPGREVLSLRAEGTALSGDGAVVGDHSIRASGTSMAAPHVAGAAALLLSARPTLTAEGVVGRLLAGGLPHPRFVDDDPRGVSSAFGPRLDLPGALASSADARAILRDVFVDHYVGPGNPGNGDGVLSAGETAGVALRLERALSPVTGLTARLVSQDPAATVETPLLFFGAWDVNRSLLFSFEVRVEEDAPPSHDATLRLELRGDDGWSQDLVFALKLNAPLTFQVAGSSFPDADFNPDVASDAEGGLVAIWNHFSVDDNNNEIQARLYDPSGTPLGGAFVLRQAEDGRVARAALDRAADGRFAAVWVVAADGPDVRVESRLFAADGTPLAPLAPLAVASTDLPERPSIAFLEDGGYVVGWDELLDDQLLAQIHDAQGVPVGDVIELEPVPTGTVSNVSVARRGDGFLAVWRLFLSFEEGIFVRGRSFDRAGQPLGPSFPISETPSFFATTPTVAPTADGFVVAWDVCDPQALACGVRARRLGSDGQPRGDEIEVGPVEPLRTVSVQVAASGSGESVVAWDGCLPGGAVNGCRVFLRQIPRLGAASDATYLIEEYPADAWEPAVAMAGDRSVVLLWDDLSPFALGLDAEDSVLGQRIPLSVLAGEPIESCDPDDPRHLCLLGERFVVTAEWRDFEGGTGTGSAVSLSDGTGYFWFFDDANVEVVVKMLDGRPLTGAHWVFYGALSNVEYTLVVTDTETGTVKRYENPSGRFASVGDTRAFPSGPEIAPRVERPESKPRTRPVMASAPEGGGGGCTTGGTSLCLLDRFSIEIAWRDFAGNEGVGSAVSLSGETGYFWFFQPGNVETIVKVLDGRPVTGAFWVFYGALSNVEYTMTVTDTVTGAVKVYENPSGRFASVGDTRAFPDGSRTFPAR